MYNREIGISGVIKTIPFKNDCDKDDCFYGRMHLL